MRGEDFQRVVTQQVHESPYETQLVGRVHKLFDPQDQARSILERQWQVNSAFVRGLQWYQWDNHRWAITPETGSAKKSIREQRNFLRPHVERSVALLTGFIPQFKVRPSTRDIEDEQAARVGTRVCQGYWTKLGMPLKSQRLAQIMTVYGHAFLKCGWNSAKGKSFPAPAMDENEQFIINPETGEVENALYYEGDFDVSVIGPDHVYVDPYATCDEDVEWMLECSNVPVEWVDRAYPEKAQYVNDIIDTSRRMGISVDDVHHGWGSLAGQEHESEGWVTKYELYRRPCPDYPEGQKVVIAGNILLEEGPNPCLNHDFPYIPFRKLLVADQYWGDTEVTDLITPQRNYNRIHSKILEHSFLFGMNMKLDWPTSAGDPQTTFMSGIGEILKRKGNQAPGYIPIPNLPSDSKEEAAQIKVDIDDISGIYSVEKGQFPGKASGIAMDLLVEQGVKKNQPVLARMAAGYERMGQMLLHDMQRYAGEERLVKVQGKHDQFDVVSFTGADLRDNTDVTIDLGSMLPKSRRMALTEVGEMAQAGLLNLMEPAQRAKAWKMLEMEDPSVISFDEDQHRRVAQQEDKLCEQGIPPEPHQIWHNLDIHVQQHFDTINSDGFKSWHPQAQAMLHAHINDTLQKAMPVAGATVTPDQMEPVEAGQEE